MAVSEAITTKTSQDLEEAGRIAAQRLFHEGRKAATIDDPLEPAFAVAAIAELERLMADELPGLARDIIEGAGVGARDLNVSPEQGLVEVIQNADDVSASRVLIAVRRRGTHVRLHVVHDGSPVRLPDVVGMTYAFFSTKREDASAKGKFGIGLKTLTQVATRMEVHCAPYHFEVVDQRLRDVRPSRSITNVYEPGSGETMLVLDLRPDYDVDALPGWARSWDVSSMLFLDSVRRIAVVDRGQLVVEHELLVEESDSVQIPCAAGLTSVARTRLRDASSSRSWTRYIAAHPVPGRLRAARAHKVTSATTPVGLAVAEGPDDRGRVFAGLPLEMRSDLPFSVHGQFDPDTSRTRLKHTRWNRWLVGQLADLAGGIAVKRFSVDPASGWRSTPLAAEGAGGDDWTVELFAALVNRVRKRVQQEVRLGRESVALKQLVYEASGLRALLDERLQQVLRPGRHPLKPDWRDGHGRWRAVIEDLGHADCLELADVIEALDWDDDDGLELDPGWVVALTAACVTADLGPELSRARSVVLADGSRVAAATMVREGLALVAEDDHATLASRLGLTRAVHPEFLSEGAQADEALSFVKKYGGFRSRPDAQTALAALSDRTGDPLPFDDVHVLALREALQGTDDDRRHELGPKIGRNILVRGTRWANGAKRSEEIQVAAAEAYLPSTIEGQADSFARAAKRTPGLPWISNHYDTLLKSKQGRRADALGARALFVLLGAETAPRLRPLASNDNLRSDWARRLSVQSRPVVQAMELASRHVTHVKQDYGSPDLDAVIADIITDRLSDRRARGRALFATLNRSWSRLYEQRQTALAYERDYVFRPRGSVVATWLARAASQPWMTNERGKAAAPYELAIRTAAYVAAIGSDPSEFAYGVGEDDVGLAVVRGLRFKHQPPASELLDVLAELRDAELRGEEIDLQRVRRCYAVLASYVTWDGTGRRNNIDDLPVAELRSRFQKRGRTPGLVRSASGWRAPNEVYSGRAVFGRWRDVAPPGAEDLWKRLGIREPLLTDCLDVLSEIAQTPYEARERSTLIDVYRRVADLLERHGRPPKGVRTIPLWTGTRWDTGSRIYAVGNPAIEEALGERLSVWRAPCSLNGLEALLDRRGIIVLHEANFQAEGITDTALRNGASAQQRFTRALTEFQSILAERDDMQYHALTLASWEDVLSLRLAITPRLRVEIVVPGRDPVSVRTRAHVDRTELLAAFADVEAIGRDDEGGWAISTLFEGGDRDKAAWAWTAAWQRSQSTGRREHLRLSEDLTDDDPLAVLEGRAVARLSKRRPPKRIPSIPQTSDDSAAYVFARPAEPPRTLIRRRLKEFTRVDIASVAIVNADADEGAMRTRRRRGLRTTIPTPPPPSRSSKNGGVGPRAYDDTQRQELAYRLLATVMNRLDDRELADYQALRGIGADALDQLERAVEMKAYSREMPASVSLSANEAEKAAEQRADYLLAVVSGLEEGYETRVRLFADPLRTLDWIQGHDIELGGVHAKRGIDVIVSDNVSADEVVP